MLAEPRALALLQNTLWLYESLLVSVCVDADYTGTVAVLLCRDLQTSPATAAVTTPRHQADTQGWATVAHISHQYPGPTLLYHWGG